MSKWLFYPMVLIILIVASCSKDEASVKEEDTFLVEVAPEVAHLKGKEMYQFKEINHDWYLDGDGRYYEYEECGATGNSWDSTNFSIYGEDGEFKGGWYVSNKENGCNKHYSARYIEDFKDTWEYQGKTEFGQVIIYYSGNSDMAYYVNPNNPKEYYLTTTLYDEVEINWTEYTVPDSESGIIIGEGFWRIRN